MSAPRELAHAARTLLRGHDEALAHEDAARVAQAAAGLLESIPLLVREAASAAPAPDARDVGADEPAPPSIPLVARAHAGEPDARLAVALESLAKRAAEVEGVLMHLRLTASNASQEDPPVAARVRRLALEQRAARRALTALDLAVESWLEAAEGAEASRRVGWPEDSLRAARECLLAEVPRAACACLARALPAALAQPFPGKSAADVEAALFLWSSEGRAPPMGAEELRGVAGLLARGTDDAAVAWRLLDFVEKVFHAAGMTRAA